MDQVKLINESRRDFLKLGIASGTGLTLGLYFNVLHAEDIGGTPSLAPNSFVRIGTDNIVTVISKHIEFGQGTYTGLATLVAEELDAAWSQIKVESAPADEKLYNNLRFGSIQGTGGSTSINNSFHQMRHAGATARSMLVSAAAKFWNVSENSISVDQGVVKHLASNQSATFGELAQFAAKLPIPKKVSVKDSKDFIYIGKQAPRVDSVAKSNGSAVFTQDINLPNMLTAVVAHPPTFGVLVKSFDATKAKSLKGVKDVVEIPTGIAVLAKDFWTAKKARDALHIEWDESNAFKLSSDQILMQYKALAKKPGAVAHTSGNVEDAFNNAEHTITSSYIVPYLAHAALEPLNCVIQLNDNSCELWYGSQIQTSDVSVISKTLDLPPEKIKINTLFAGGSFGRRANPLGDYVEEAANIAKASKLPVPIKMVWTREDDTQAGYYRPMFYHELRAAIDGDGKVTAWHQRIVGQSVMTGSAWEEAFVKNGVDASSVEGVSDLPYAITNKYVDVHIATLPIPVQWWRSVGHSHTAFAKEAFLDQIAHKINKDPVQLRRELLIKHPRALAVLNLAAEKSNWTSPLGKNKGRGIALHKSFHTHVAQVAEITVNEDRSFSVDRVVIAVDCGIAINPDTIRAQMEGGMGYGLSAVLNSAITFKDGLIEQSNFDGYQVLRINQMPIVEVHIIESNEDPTGVGEPGTPPIAPAVINAIADATGIFHHTLPLPRTV